MSSPTSRSDSEDSNFDPQELVRHGRFVQALARELAKDADEADELAAKAFATSLVKRPQSRAGLRTWLREVVWRLFRRARRDDERRRRHEQAAGRERALASSEAGSPCAAPATVELVARVELERHVALAFAELAEPYRTTLFLRFFDDLAPKQIAAREGVPVETVKTRLKRGLERLRVALDARHEQGREGWRAVAIGFVLPPRVLATMKAKLAAAAAIAAACVGLATWSEATGGSVAASTAGVAAMARSSTVAPRSSPVASGESSSASSVRRVEEIRVSFATGCVVAESGVPLAGVALVASRVFECRRTKDGIEYAHEPIDLRMISTNHLATTDEVGRFTIVQAPSDLASIYFVKPGFTAAEWWDLSPDPAENQDHRVVLSRGRRITGRVVDSSGRPIPSAGVTVLEQPIPRSEQRIARAAAGTPSYWAGLREWRFGVDRDGGFVLDSPPAKKFSVALSAFGYGSSSTTDANVGDRIDATLVRDGVLLDVVDAVTREPLEDARAMVGFADERLDRKLVAAWWQSSSRSSAELTRAIGLPPAGRLLFGGGTSLARAIGERDDLAFGARFHVLAPHHRTREIELDLDEKLEPPHVIVELEPGEDAPTIAGRIHGGAGAHVDVRSLESGCSEDERHRIAQCEADGEGRFELRGLPAASYRLFVTAPERAPRWLDVEAPALALAIDLVAGASLEVAVVDVDGAARPGAIVHVQTIDEVRAWVVRAGADGVARFEELPDGRLAVAAYVDDRDGALVGSPRVCHPNRVDERDVVALAPAEHARIVRRIPTRVRATLHAQRRDGSAVAGVKLQWCGRTGSFAEDFVDDDELRGLELVTDENGDATFEGFPGSHQFRAFAGPRRFGCDATLTREGADDRQILVPEYSGRGSIRGTLFELGGDLRVTGRPIAITSIDEGGETRDGTNSGIHVAAPTTCTAMTDAAGDFAFEDVPVGSYRLVVCEREVRSEDGREPSASWPYRPATTAVVVESDETVELDLEVARDGAPRPGTLSTKFDLEVLDDATDQPIADACIAIAGIAADADHDLATLKTAADGHLHATLAATEHYSVVITHPDFEEQELTVIPVDGVAADVVRLVRSR
jgi:RNA polymerase sigma-70 factor (ECF subfamily)